MAHVRFLTYMLAPGFYFPLKFRSANKLYRIFAIAFLTSNKHFYNQLFIFWEFLI
jgi:hypothetical protein